MEAARTGAAALSGSARVMATRAFSYPQPEPRNSGRGTRHATGGGARLAHASSAARVRSRSGTRNGARGLVPDLRAGNQHAGPASAVAGLR
jgi:hypothetical protein